MTRRCCPHPAQGERLAFSTDSFVVTPHFFPGGDIGRLAVCGTVNDVATSGATPALSQLRLRVGRGLSHGGPAPHLRQHGRSGARRPACDLVTGDTKVVNRGHGDGMYINTAGVGALADGREPGRRASVVPGDAVLVSGTLGDHGITIMSCREGCRSPPTMRKRRCSPEPPHRRGAGRGAATRAASATPRAAAWPQRSNELAAQSGADITVEEDAVPVKPAVLGACEMLGYDVLQVANEGKMVCVVAAEEADAALAAMRANPYGADAAIIGEVSEARARARPEGVSAHGLRRHAHPGHAGGRAAAAHLLDAFGRQRSDRPRFSSGSGVFACSAGGFDVKRVAAWAKRRCESAVVTAPRYFPDSYCNHRQ